MSGLKNLIWPFTGLKGRRCVLARCHTCLLNGRVRWCRVAPGGVVLGCAAYEFVATIEFADQAGRSETGNGFNG